MMAVPFSSRLRWTYSSGESAFSKVTKAPSRPFSNSTRRVDSISLVLSLFFTFQASGSAASGICRDATMALRIPSDGVAFGGIECGG
jgi:hypothetical protein